MAVSLTCRRAFAENGVFKIQWSDKVEQEFLSRAQAREFADNILSKDTLRALMILRWLTANPAGDNPNLIQSRTITGDPSSNSIVTIS